MVCHVSFYTQQMHKEKTHLMLDSSHPRDLEAPAPPSRPTQPLNKRDKYSCVLQALVIFIKNNFGSKNSTLNSVILSIKKTIIQEQIQKILNYENKSIKAPFIYIMYTQMG